MVILEFLTIGIIILLSIAYLIYIFIKKAKNKGRCEGCSKAGNCTEQTITETKIEKNAQ